MEAFDILRTLWADGFSVALIDDDRLRISPSSALSDEQRSTLRRAKPELVAYLLAARETTSALLLAAAAVCDRHGDGPEARLEMRGDCLALPVHLHADLLDHFRKIPADRSRQKPIKAGVFALPPACARDGPNA
ncbi:hypothetical protein [Variovorax sp. LG9.2]|uniref:hypothetical protein n=1 Tax=Variovorax sp. LG9.2 TaxID=3048626 RepID=UPI002B22C150|nr:hypothetical protein [Variovorax sp. LG9.2]MEB0058809.1 hypothetical protein [Variovorax sp. LG9.2]